MALATSVATAGVLAAAAYLDAKYSISKDVSALRRVKKGERQYAQDVKDGRTSLWYAIADACKAQHSNEAIWTRNGSCTFTELHDRSVQYGQWMLEQGVRPGDLVAMYMFNSAEFIMIWFGLLSIGAAPAFMNYSLEGKALLHCLNVCETKLLIVQDDEGCQRRVHGSQAEIVANNTKIVTMSRSLQSDIYSKPVIVPGDEYRKDVKGQFPFCLIYTSGTTGLPKGCAFTTARTRLIGSHYDPPFDSKPGVDRWYNSMPLYHGTGALSSSCTLMGGVGIALAEKFSVSKFWPDIHDSGSTWFVYVGETARYLLNAPPHPLERSHKLRGAYGNGLRPDVWEKFQTRFNVPEIAEFFNSSEGMFTLVVWDRGPYLAKCVGHHGIVLRTLLQNVYIPVKIDHETGDIWRDPKTGFAQRMPYEEGGEMIVAIPNKAAFQGYWRSEAATDKKYCADVFKKGDIYYRSGDALRRNADGKWYFMDRLGDTFRWKSENVSTAEVAEVLGQYPGIAEANVYGVLVPNHEGRAGCAAIHVDPNWKEEVDYDAVLQYARARLPRYAVPVFLRLVTASSHIHNHKQNKTPLRKEGVDPRLIGSEATEGKDDVILWVTPKTGSYVEFSRADWDALEAGKARL